MANDVPTEEDYDDGLAPPPELPPLAISQTGTEEQAKCLQISNSVPERFRGPWYHETYTGQESFDNQHEEWTWFTRSPSGGTIWGDRVSQVYVIDTLADTRLHATDNKGDRNGYDGADPLPDWWMGVGREDISKVMVVSTIDPKTDKAKLEALLNSEEYKATRRAAIEKLQASKKPKASFEKPPPKHEEIAVAAYYIWQKGGKGDGKDKVHWEQATTELRK